MKLKRTIQISLETAKFIYKGANSEMKRLLEENFTKEELSDDITEIIKDFDDVLEYLGISIKCYKSIYNLLPNDKIKAVYDISLIELALNENNVPKIGEERYAPWFQNIGSGLVFYGSDCGSYGSYGAVGYFRKESISNYAGKNFLSYYDNFFNS